MNNSFITCSICNSTFECNDKFEDHIIKDHMMSYSKYYEYSKINHDKCNICGSSLVRVSPWFPIYNPCINCSPNRMYFDQVMMNINKIHGIICGNKYIKLFLLNKELRENLTEFDLFNYCNSLENISIEKDLYSRYDDINIFDIRKKLGTSPFVYPDLRDIVITDSIFNIKKSEIVRCDDNYCNISIKGTRYKIYLPESCEYHNNNHYKYNILNRNNKSQSSKKLLLSSGNCIKFYNTNFDGCKSILKVSREDEDIYSTSLDEEELKYIKFYIMSNSLLLRYILNILNEIIRNSDTVYDYCFLLNKVAVNPSGKFDMIIDWNVNNRMISSDKEILNISIL